MTEIATDDSHRTPLILIADDDSSIRSLLMLALQEEGYEVEESVNGEDCLAKFDRLQPDLVMLDAVMPEMDGLTCCQRLRERTDGQQVPILMITFLDDRESIDRSFAAGATDYITKPIQWSVLRQRVKRLLTSFRLSKEAENRQERESWELFTREILRQSTRSLNIPETITLARQFFSVARILVYPVGAAPIEASAPGYPAAGGVAWSDWGLEAGYASRYRRGETIALDDLDRAGLPPALVDRFASFGTGSLLLVPLLARQRFLGLLCVHRALSADPWQEREIERFSDLANVLALGIGG